MIPEEKRMKMYVWHSAPSFLAVAQADSVAKARELLLSNDTMGESGDGSCHERDKAREYVKATRPHIWYGANAEFVLTDSAELQEQETLTRVLEQKNDALRQQVENIKKCAKKVLVKLPPKGRICLLEEIEQLKEALASTEAPKQLEPEDEALDVFGAYLRRQEEWSRRTFGPSNRTIGIVKHIQKELQEILAQPHDLEEWIDLMILALEGYWQNDGQPEHLMAYLQAKQDKNFARKWPKVISRDLPMEHLREDIAEALKPSPTEKQVQDYLATHPPSTPGPITAVPVEETMPKESQRLEKGLDAVERNFSPYAPKPAPSEEPIKIGLATEHKDFHGQWHIETVRPDGSVEVSVFTGPDARARAEQYSRWLSDLRKVKGGSKNV